MTGVLGIVPARGGSKRIKDKNIADFFGRPIVAYTLDAMAASGVFEEIHVSTDSPRIAEVAGALGFPPAFARGAFAGDSDGVLDVGRWVLAEYARRGRRFETVGFAMACSPLLEARDFTEGYAGFVAGGRRPQLAVAEYPAPPQQALLVAPDGAVAPLAPADFVRRSQDLPATVFDTGAFAFFRARALSDGESDNFAAYRGFRIARHKAHDINTPADIDYARIVFAGRRALGTTA